MHISARYAGATWCRYLYTSAHINCKAKQSTCIAPCMVQTTFKCSGMDHTAFNLQRTPCLPLPRKHSPDSASTEYGGEHLIAAHYSFIDPERMKGWVGLVGWRVAGGLRKWSPVLCRSSAGRRKNAGQRLTFYRWAKERYNLITLNYSKSNLKPVTGDWSINLFIGRQQVGRLSRDTRPIQSVLSVWCH